jgi:hypothetical protein
MIIWNPDAINATRRDRERQVARLQLVREARRAESHSERMLRLSRHLSSLRHHLAVACHPRGGRHSALVS